LISVQCLPVNANVSTSAVFLCSCGVARDLRVRYVWLAVEKSHPLVSSTMKAVVLVAVAFLVCACRLARGGANPCHKNSNKSKPSGCEQIRIPWGMCKACPIAPIVSNPVGGQEVGDFVDCTRTYDLSSSQCQAKIQRYVDVNSCDTARSDALNNYLHSSDPGVVEDSRQILDYFVYSICEQGCDCIPQENATRQNRTAEVRRGNCQAHAYYDICRILPDIKLIKRVGTSSGDVTSLPKACDLLTDWFNSPASQGWAGQAYTAIEPSVTYFLERAVEAVQLSSWKVWNECFNLESAQGRI